MTWPANGGLFIQPWINKLQGVSTVNFQLGPAGSPDAFKVALFNNSVSSILPNPYSVTLPNTVYGVGDWTSTNEVSSGGAYPTGGVTPGSPTLSESPQGTLMWTLANVTASGTTMANIWGCLIYDFTLATKYGLCAVPFGAAYSTTAGTFGITWAAGGIFNIDITP